MIRVSRTIVIEDSEVEFEFIRSSGPGGQNVNKVATAVRLRFDVRGSRSLPGDVRERLEHIVRKKINAEGILTIRAQRHRTQEANRRDAVERLALLIRRACEKPRPRYATRPTAASKNRRLESKRRAGRAKADRRAVHEGAE